MPYKSLKLPLTLTRLLWSSQNPPYPPQPPTAPSIRLYLFNFAPHPLK